MPKVIMGNVRNRNDAKIDSQVVEKRKELSIVKCDKEVSKEHCYEKEMNEVSKYSYRYSGNERNRPYLSIVSGSNYEKGISRQKIKENNKNH